MKKDNKSLTMQMCLFEWAVCPLHPCSSWPLPQPSVEGSWGGPQGPLTSNPFLDAQVPLAAPTSVHMCPLLDPS